MNRIELPIDSQLWMNLSVHKELQSSAQCHGPTYWATADIYFRESEPHPYYQDDKGLRRSVSAVAWALDDNPAAILDAAEEAARKAIEHLFVHARGKDCGACDPKFCFNPPKNPGEVNACPNQASAS